jgi:chemotaxis protein methyltransferase CheR
LVTRNDDGAELRYLINHVTTNKTSFFREPHHFDFLREQVLRPLQQSPCRTLRIWSAGCSTGEEPYSIAMMLRELLPASAGWDVKVVATDVSRAALDAARKGVYGARAVMNATPEDLGRFFVALPDGQYEVRQEVRDLVELRHHNLVTEPVPYPSNEHIDLVLCRNVTIYFARETTRELMKRLHECLRDGGYLFLGHSETLWQVSEDFHLVSLGSGESAAFVYRRLDEVKGGERRRVLPDRRTGEDPKPAERRVKPRRAERVVEFLNKPVPVPKQKPKPPSADELVARTRAALSQGRYDEAAGFAAEAVAAEPMRAEAFYLGGLALVDLGDDDRALVELRKAVYLDPQMGFAHFLLAGVLDRLGDPQAAAREYAAAADTLGLAPGDATAEELGGRSVRELAQLCRQLERRYTGEPIEGVS